MYRFVCVYGDQGVCPESKEQTLRMLQQTLPHFPTRVVSAQDILSGCLAKAVLLVMPGGADLPYGRQLNGLGNKAIASFVENGGSYLGICAGAYYGSRRVRFDEGGKHEVLGFRELAFFKGSAVGPLLAPYSPRIRSGARIASLMPQEVSWGSIDCYFNGGCFFTEEEADPNLSVLAWYSIPCGPLPGIVHVKIGTGQVILSGVHFEYDSFDLDESDSFLAPLISTLQIHEARRREWIQNLWRLLKLSSV